MSHVIKNQHKVKQSNTVEKNENEIKNFKKKLKKKDFFCISFLPQIGKHCCLWCLISKEEMKLPIEIQDPSLLRSIQSLSSLEEFQSNEAKPLQSKRFSRMLMILFSTFPLNRYLQFRLNSSLLDRYTLMMNISQ